MKSSSFQSASLICVALLVSPAHATADQLIISSDRVDQAVWGAAATDSYARQPAEEIPFLEFTVELYRRNPNADPQQVLHYIDGVRALVQERYRRGDPSPPGQPGTGIATYDYYNGAVDVIGSFPFSQYTFVPFVLTSMREAKKLSDTIYDRRMAPIYSLASLARRDAYAEAERLNKSQVLNDAQQQAQSNGKAAVVIQALAQRSLGNAQEIFAAYPDFASLPAIQVLRSFMNDRGEIVTSTEQLRALFGTQIQNLQDTVSSNLTLLHELAVGQQVLLSYMTNAQLRAQLQETVAREQAAYEQKIQAANASVYVLSTLIGFQDPELGHQMQVVGNSTIQVADAIHKFTQGQAAGLGGVILTGNLLGATMNVVALFRHSGPSPDQQILQAIAQLRQQINQLRIEMHDRFDRVDAALNQIYATMNDRFNRIDVTLGILVGDVQEIQESLYNLQSDLYRIESKLFAFLDAGFRFDLNEAINGSLGYRENFGQPIPYDGVIPSFIWAENRFLTWAVDNSRNELLSGSAGRGYDDASVYAELGAPTSQPLENNFNYIAQYLTSKGWPSFTQVRLANPRDWAIAAESYMQLAADSPIFFRRISSNRIEQIYRIGQDLQRAVGNITVLQTNPPTANRVLFNALFANYRAKASLFKQRLEEKEEEYRINLSADSNRREALLALDLWGGPNQTTVWRPTISVIQPSQLGGTRGLNDTLPLQQSSWNWITQTPNAVLIADLLSTTQIAVTWGDYDYVETLMRLYSQEGKPRTVHCSVGQFQLVLRVEASGKPVAARRLVTDTWANPDTSIQGLGILAPTVVRVTEGWIVPQSAIEVHHQTNTFLYSFQNLFTWSDMLALHWNGGRVTKTQPAITVNATVALKDNFATRSQDWSNSVPPENAENIRTLVDLRLRELQRGSYNSVSFSLSQATSLQAAANELSGAKAVLEAMVVLGFSESLESDDFIRALLFGSEQLVDTDTAKELCLQGIDRTHDTNQNAKVDIAVILDARIAGLETWVSNRLSQIQTNGQPESLRLVSSTLSRLEAFRALWHQPTPPPYLSALGAPITNGIPSKLFIPWGEPNLRYSVQFSTNLTQWADLPTPVDEGQEFITPLAGRSGFYRAVLRP